MKKRVVFGFLIILLIINISFVFAQESNTTSEKGYDCLESKVKDKCSSLSTEEKIFSLLAIEECKQEVLSDALNNECWPKTGCKIKTTAQAMLALEEVNADVNKSATWLLSQKMVPTGIDWLLQIESNKPVSCTITYSGSSYPVSINEDKKISSDAGSCLNLYDGDYWLKVSTSTNCYNTEFEISCNETFSTNLLYKEQSSSIFYVSQETHSASAEGRTKEKVNSFCFKQGSSCDYEGTLWAALVLNTLDYDTSPYIPYLVSFAENNQRYLPEVFLYILLGESYRNDILLKQRENKWWVESGDKFYDTALALYPFQYEELTEKINSMNWLGEVQGNDGCWQGNIRNTAFILYSIWPKELPGEDGDGGEGEIDCEDADYYCMLSANCENVGGIELDYTGCFGANICCNKQIQLETCEEQAGEICNSEQTCVGGTTVGAFDLDSDETCCISGECEIEEEKSECEVYDGECRTDCFSNEKEETEYECFGSDVCCVEKAVKPKRGYVGIYIFAVLIVLVILGIIFRKKLRALLSKFKRKPGKSEYGPGFIGPGGFPPSSPGLPQRIMPRRILPSQARQPVRSIPPRKPEGEFSEVLRKLKEMGK